MEKFDVLIVGGGVVSSYLIKKLGGSGLKIAVIDKFDCINDRIEADYYRKIAGYANKGFGGLSEFWGGQIQDIDYENILAILNSQGFNCTKSEIDVARDRVKGVLQVNINNSLSSENRIESKYKRVLNSWIGKTRLIGREAESIIIKNQIYLKRGKVNKITFNSFKKVFEIKFADNNCFTDIIYSEKVFFCGGVLGLAEYILENNPTKVLSYSDHYSISIANVSKYSELGKLISPYFSKRRLITPRIYFKSSDFSNYLSLYSTIPFQKELGEMRQAKKDSTFSVLLYIIKSENFFQFSLFVLKMGCSFLFNKKIPLKANRLDINVFVDTNLLKNGTISLSNGNILVKSATKLDFAELKENVFKKLIQLDSKRNNILKEQHDYFECGYHAYCLTDEHGFNASKELTDIGVNVFSSSEIKNIGDSNPVFTTLVLTELKFNKIFSLG
jgi:hypothetical protein